MFRPTATAPQRLPAFCARCSTPAARWSTARRCTDGPKRWWGSASPRSGRATARSWRPRCGRAARQAGIDEMRRSLALLGTPQLDLMQIHNLLDWRTHLATLRDWKAEGTIRYLGVTHYTASAHADLAAVLRTEPLDFVQVNYSLEEPEAAQGTAAARRRPRRRRDREQAVRRWRPRQAAARARAARMGRGDRLPDVVAAAAEVRPGAPGGDVRHSRNGKPRSHGGRLRGGIRDPSSIQSGSTGCCSSICAGRIADGSSFAGVRRLVRDSDISGDCRRGGHAVGAAVAAPPAPPPPARRRPARVRRRRWIPSARATSMSARIPRTTPAAYDFKRDIDAKAAIDARYAEASQGVMDFQKVTYRSSVGDMDIPAYLFQPLKKRGAEGHAAMVWVHGGVHGNWGSEHVPVRQGGGRARLRRHLPGVPRQHRLRRGAPQRDRLRRLRGRRRDERGRLS